MPNSRFFGLLQAVARSGGRDRGARKERSDGIGELREPSRFRFTISARSGERGKGRDKKKGAALVPNSLFFGSLQAVARSGGRDRGARKERSDGIGELREPSRFRFTISARSGERGKGRDKKKGAALVPNSLFFGSLQAVARSGGRDRGARTHDLCDVNTAL